MRLTSELTVGAPLERIWPALLELGGPLSVELGTRYEGTARLDDTDEDEHAAGFHALGRERGGNGLASATILARATEEAGATRIAVETELMLTGAAARPDQREAQAAADGLLARLATHLEREAGSDPQEVPEPTKTEPPALEGPDPSPRELDVWVVAGKVAERALLVVAGAALGLALGNVLRRRR